jgi:protein-tyrosine phosphatase
VEVTATGTGRVYFHLKPRSGVVRVVSIRRLPLESSPNFRDLGGYRAADGRHVRWGLAYRSGKLDTLTAKEYEYLAGIGLEMVTDFRLDWERQRNPTKWPGVPRPIFLVNPIDSYGPPANAAPTPNAAAATAGQPVRVPRPEYWWVDDATEQYALTFRLMASGSLPMLFHCAAGKDRTGVMAALLLSALGVPRDVIMADYVLTNTYLVPDSKLPQLTADLQKRRKLDSPPDPDTVRGASGGVDRRWLEAALAAIDKKYGSVEGYLRQELKLTPAQLAAVRNRLLEP